MDFKATNKGKSLSASTPSFSFRYNAEDEEVEQVFTATIEKQEIQKAEDSSSSSMSLDVKDESKSKDSSPILSKANKRTGSLEESGSPEPWRILTEIKGRITKTVEEKIEEIKSDRIKLAKKKKLLNTSSLSDSEERSEASSSIKDISDKSNSEKQKDFVADSDLGDISDTSLTPDRATPIVSEADVSETTPSKEQVSQVISSPKKVPLPSISANPDAEKVAHLLHKKTKSKARTKIEMGIEAVEETSGREEGRFTQMMNVDSVRHSARPSSLFPNISVRTAVYFALLGVLYAFVNVPQFLFGLIVGGFLSIDLGFWSDGCVQQLNKKSKDLSTMHLSTRSSMDNSTLSTSSELNKVYEGWMNEFCYEYQPEIYHVTQTETVYVRLEGSTLKLASPRQKISKRAFWNEPNYKLRFDRERTYEISGCQVVLLPEKLAHKRIWSKKYPICIILKPNSHLGTRYRERGAPSLELVSFKGHSAKKVNGPENDQDDCSISGIELEKKKEDMTDDEGEVVFYSDEEDEDDGLSNDYVKIPTSIINKNNIYLFARSDREKDQWFRRLVAASKSDLKLKSEESSESISESTLEKEEPFKSENPDELYYSFVSRLIGRKITSQGSDNSFDVSEEEEEGLIWFNLFLGRILFDPMHDPYWIKQIQEKIQKKLSAIKVPTFMEELLVSHIELCDSVPVIERSSIPKMNVDGIWVDLDLTYRGTFKMIIDTKINIIKLKNSCGTPSKTEGNESPEILEKAISKPAIFDSEIEDSAESSCDDMDIEDLNSKTPNSRNTSQKVLQMVDKIAASKYFQQVTDNKYVKKALEGVSNTTISLMVEVKSLTGTIVLNFPPPPSDRLWYGFRPNTKLGISAKPKVGQRGINMAYITNYIEKKLLREFEKLLVMPNMDDLIIPVMNKIKPS